MLSNCYTIGCLFKCYLIFWLENIGKYKMTYTDKIKPYHLCGLFMICALCKFHLQSFSNVSIRGSCCAFTVCLSCGQVARTLGCLRTSRKREQGSGPPKITWSIKPYGQELHNQFRLFFFQCSAVTGILQF